MTLSIYSITPKRVLHASDTQISYGVLGPRRDNARKLMFYVSKAARMILSFSGLAEVKTTEADWETIEQWLVRILPSLDTTTVYAFAITLLDRLSPAAQSTGIALAAAEPQSCVVLAGFDRECMAPKVLWLSNFDKPWRGLGIGTGHALVPPPDVQPFRTAGTFELRGILSSSPSCLLIHGDYTALDTAAIGFLQRLGQPPNADASTACDLLVDAIRHAADANPQGSVGPDCWTQVLERSSQHSLWTKHFRDPNMQTPSPLYFGPFGAMPMLVSEKLPSYQTALARLNNGFTSDLLVGGTLLAYLDWSPVLIGACRVMSQSGVDVLAAETEHSPNVQGLIEASGCTTAHTLERYLQRTDPWAFQLVESFAKQIVAEHKGEKVSTFRRRVLALLLVSLNPDRYPIEQPLPHH